MDTYEYKDKTMIYKFTLVDYKSRTMKHGRVLETGHLHFNDKPENVADLLSYEMGG